MRAGRISVIFRVSWGWRSDEATTAVKIQVYDRNGVRCKLLGSLRSGQRIGQRYRLAAHFTCNGETLIRMKSSQRSPKSAFTLVEVLVVIAVIGLLVALMVPAIQQARESARKTACANNLKQIGLGMQAYVLTRQAFPPGYVSKVAPDHDDDGPGWAWGATLMPQLEEAPLHDEIDYTASLRSPEMKHVVLTSVPLFICPSDDLFERIIDIPSKSSTRIICQMAAGNYVASAGTIRPTCKICRDSFDGVFGRNRAIKPKELQDGLSKTLAIGERASRWSRPVVWGVLPNSKVIDNQQPGLYAAGPAFVLGTTFNEGFNIETSTEMDHGTMGTFAESFGSQHPGGAFFLFCDAGVRFVWDDADPSILNALSTRDGNPHSGVERIIHESPF
jgi:prepilin-type N-terminal cleavage/methylation domain-containing protein